MARVKKCFAATYIPSINSWLMGMLDGDALTESKEIAKVPSKLMA
jgi:hypothetical protein